MVPVVVFLAIAVVEGMGPGAALRAMAEQASGGRPSLVAAGILFLFPVLLLLLGLRLGRRFDPDGEQLPALGWAGLAAVLAVQVWANASFWRLYLPDRTSPGFPHGLELVIAPLFFAPAVVAVTALVGFLMLRTGK